MQAPFNSLFNKCLERAKKQLSRAVALMERISITDTHSPCTLPLAFLQRSLYFHFFKCFYYIPNFNIVVVFNGQSALHTAGNFFGIISKAF